MHYMCKHDVFEKNEGEGDVNLRFSHVYFLGFFVGSFVRFVCLFVSLSEKSRDGEVITLGYCLHN